MGFLYECHWGVTVDLASLRSFGADGNDTLSGIEGARGGIDEDTLIGSNTANESLEGGLGNDSLAGQGGTADWAIYTNASGNVTVDLASGSSSGADGADTLAGIEGAQGGNFDDSLLGDSQSNGLSGGTGNDTLSGGDDNDTLRGGEGDDSLIGGAGSGDWAVFASPVTVDLATGTAFGEGVDTLSGIENIRGTSAAQESIAGDSQDNILVSGNAINVTTADTLLGRAGNNTLIGANSSVREILIGGEGNDSLFGNGGGGQDMASYAYANGSVTVDLTTGRATGADGNDSLASIQWVRGGNEADSLLGDSVVNRLDGGFGNDTLDGGAGNDIVSFQSLFGCLAGCHG